MARQQHGWRLAAGMSVEDVEELARPAEAGQPAGDIRAVAADLCRKQLGHMEPRRRSPKIRTGIGEKAAPPAGNLGKVVDVVYDNSLFALRPNGPAWRRSLAALALLAMLAAARGSGMQIQ